MYSVESKGIGGSSYMPYELLMRARRTPSVADIPVSIADLLLETAVTLPIDFGECTIIVLQELGITCA